MDSPEIQRDSEIIGSTVERRAFKRRGGDRLSEQLPGLLDKLVALQMDLEPCCGASTARASVAVSLEIVTHAREMVSSAVEDLQIIIRQQDGYDG